MGKIRLQKLKESDYFLKHLHTSAALEMEIKCSPKCDNLPCVLRRHPPPPDSSLQRQPAAESHLRRSVSFHSDFNKMLKKKKINDPGAL